MASVRLKNLPSQAKGVDLMSLILLSSLVIVVTLYLFIISL